MALRLVRCARLERVDAARQGLCQAFPRPHCFHPCRVRSTRKVLSVLPPGRGGKIPVSVNIPKTKYPNPAGGLVWPGPSGFWFLLFKNLALLLLTRSPVRDVGAYLPSHQPTGGTLRSMAFVIARRASSTAYRLRVVEDESFIGTVAEKVRRSKKWKGDR